MICADARRLLGAYRREDLSPGEEARLTEHLASCAACREKEAAFHDIGAMVRRLPNLVPPPAFREAVFAAIRAEQLRTESPAERLARAETDPGLPVVRGRPVTRRPRRGARPLNTRAVAAVAAVFLLAALTAYAVPGLTGRSLGDAVGNLFGGHGKSPTVDRYTPDAHYPLVASALAVSGWLAYSASDSAGDAMLFAQDRRTGTNTPLLATPAHTPLLLRTLTAHWAVWLAGTGHADAPWALRASHLPASSSGAAALPALTLAENANSGDSSPDAPVALNGVWAQGDTVLVAETSRAGTGVLLDVDLSSGSPSARVIARASAPGHLLTDPSAENGTIYWADVWNDAATGPHSTIWRTDGAGQARMAFDDDHAFRPLATHSALAWVEVPATAASGSGDAAGVARALETLRGALVFGDAGGAHRREITPVVDAASVQAAGPLLLWRDQGREHAYDLRTSAPSALDALVRAASYVGADAEAVAWGDGPSSPIAVYDIH